jgi:hypothetical protein
MPIGEMAMHRRGAQPSGERGGGQDEAFAAMSRSSP